MSRLDHFKRKPRREPLDAGIANTLPPDDVAASLGLGVSEYRRNHIRLDNGIRGTLKEDGHTVWCHPDQQGIGDNLALAMLTTGLPFREAYTALVGAPQAAPAPKPKPKPAPAHTGAVRLVRGSDEDREAGRAYLLGRGMLPAALDLAEGVRFLTYIPGALVFVGYDGLRPLSATRRGYLPGDPHPKRDLANSNKAYPPVIPGDPDAVWIVEGGVDALALVGLTLLAGLAVPTVIVSGGVGTRSWLDTPAIRARIERASTVTVASEHEKDATTQERTDELRQKQVARLRELCPDVRIWTPPPGTKDLGEARSLSHV